jgi:DNA-binding phage protein
MKVVSTVKASRDVNKALREAVKQVNRELKNASGVITKLECDVSLIPSGASVSVMATINGEQTCRKEVLGVNTRGGNRDRSIRKATESLNGLLKDKNGEIIYIYSKTVAPLPGRVYTTMIVAINEGAKEPVAKDTNARRERIKKTLELLGNAPASLNIVRVAEVFGVSRSIIYRDLEVLGFERVGEAEK